MLRFKILNKRQIRIVIYNPFIRVITQHASKNTLKL